MDTTSRPRRCINLYVLSKGKEKGVTMAGQPKELYGSHLPVLTRLMDVTHGPVLELGMGLYSTPLLHTLCTLQNRFLVSYDSDPVWFEENKKWQNMGHSVIFVPDDKWEEAQFDEMARHWSIAFVDHKPAKRRKDEIKRLAGIATFVIIHDTEPESDRYFKYSWMEKYYKYRYQYSKLRPFTSVWSNFVDPIFLF